MGIRRLVWGLALSGLLAVASGAAQTLHHHDGAADHSRGDPTQNCSVCQLIATVAKVTVDPAQTPDLAAADTGECVDSYESRTPPAFCLGTPVARGPPALLS
jgi:hypothetical protein